MAHDESNWLVSYADLMTLLFGFFVLMYTFSKVDKDRFEVVSRDLVKYFGGKMTDPAFPSDAFKARSEQLTTELRQMGLEIEASQQNGASSLTLTLGTDVLFSPGSAQLTPQAMAAAQKLAQTLLKVNVDKIEVEGHTDSDPIRSALYPSNWELSTARAASLVRALEYMKVPRQHLKAAG
ncbi:MAG TPA: flagellar motor protein MotB, partial [Pseudobdellovibrionaceae bacterium]|nr:flagellar motor protein MotB [Pseudobdellovibrionaceae bacterium]